MIETTPTQHLYSRLGRVGSIAAIDLWESRRSVAAARNMVATIAALSYGRDAAANPDGLFDKIMRDQHLAVLDFVPVLPSEFCQGSPDRFLNLPHNSLRHSLSLLFEAQASRWGEDVVRFGRRVRPAHAFLVEAPIFVARQWMRHRAFSYLEMSRRFTPPGRVGLEFYGQWDEDPARRARREPFWDAVRDEFERRQKEESEPLELARGCYPVETMTKFWVGGYDFSWLEQAPIEHEDDDELIVERVPGFTGLRSEPHAQQEIRVFSDWIRDYLTPSKIAA